MSSRRPKVKIRKRENVCPHCGKYVNAAATLGPDQAAPTPGDLSLCVKCVNLCKYGPDLTLVRLTPAETVEAMMDDEVAAMVARAKRGHHRPGGDRVCRRVTTRRTVRPTRRPD